MHGIIDFEELRSYEKRTNNNSWNVYCEGPAFLMNV